MHGIAYPQLIGHFIRHETYPLVEYGPILDQLFQLPSSCASKAGYAVVGRPQPPALLCGTKAARASKTDTSRSSANRFLERYTFAKYFSLPSAVPSAT